MSGNNATPDSEWIRLNVGGKVFQTTKSTLSIHPESFLARLANGNIPSEKDESGAFLIDRNYEHFGSILNFFRSGVVNLDRNEKAVRDLLCEADFYNVQSLVNEIHKAMGAVTNRTEMVIVLGCCDEQRSIGQEIVRCIAYIQMSEKSEDYEVLQALRQKVGIKTDNSNGLHFIIDHNDELINLDTWMNIELTLRNFGFVKEEISEGEAFHILYKTNQKFVRTIRQ
ncbi:BTB/POZ domain-containing protein [Ditylenchus destructor]|nr:BTB/POZ domain-containing protein [Ditylenchus destructor]